MKKKRSTVRSRNKKFALRAKTALWHEQPAPNNPYIAASCRCHGYDLFDLASKRRFSEVLFLLFRGELPTADKARLLEILLIGLINPGPRHPATRAAMNAGIGRTDPAHLLPIGLTVLGGHSAHVQDAMCFLRDHVDQVPERVAEECMAQAPLPDEGDWSPAPGFGSLFNGIDIVPQRLVELMMGASGNVPFLLWGNEFSKALNAGGAGWLTMGVAAAVYLELGFEPHLGAGLFQLMRAPGMLAHATEQYGKPITSMPFVDDQHYVIEN